MTSPHQVPRTLRSGAPSLHATQHHEPQGALQAAAPICCTQVLHFAAAWPYSRGMTRISVSLDDPVAEAAKAAAGGDGQVSKWVANLIRERLITDAAAAAAAYDRQTAGDDDIAWEAERMAGRA